MTQVSIDQALQIAMENHRAGRLTAAEDIYRRILQHQPDHAHVMSLLGTLEGQLGRTEAAVDLISRAIALNPSEATYSCNLGEIYRRAGKTDEAIVLLRQAVAMSPDMATARNNLGAALKEKGCVEEAIVHYRRAIELKSDYSEAHNNLGIALDDQGHYDEAIASLRRAIQCQPGYGEAYSNLGAILQSKEHTDEAIAAFRTALQLAPNFAEAHNNLGNSLRIKREFDAAIASIRRALELKPTLADAWNSLGNVLRDKGELDHAITAYQQALGLNPRYAEAHSNLGNVLKDQGRIEEMLKEYHTAVEIKPDSSLFHYNLGNGLHEAADFKGALAGFAKAISLDPNHASAHWNFALTCLLLGDFQRGWEEYEWRWTMKSHLSLPDLAKPRWTGGDLMGKTILVFAEQGFGDTFQFIRLLPLLRQRGCRVILGCEPESYPLLKNFQGADEVASGANPLPAFDLCCPLLSLPGALAITPETIPAEIPYIAADAERSQAWKERLGNAEGNVRVGIAWSGRATHKNDRHRSVPLHRWSAILATQGVEFHSLQQGEAAAQAASEARVIDHSAELTDFGETAALIEQMDLVIAVDTAVVHLAGAMGKPVWALLTYVPDWRWMLDRDDNPWYPAMRLFRQKERGNWDEVIRRAADALSKIQRECALP